MKKYLFKTSTILILLFTLFSLTACQPHEHVYGEWLTEQEATCTSDGIEIRTCSCGEKDSRTIAATGHSFGNWTTVIAATCTAEGQETGSCSCGESENRTLKATGHSFDNWTTVTAATCTAEGEETGTCYCGEVETRTIKAIGHTYDTGTVSKDATCEAVGEKIYTCTVCKETKNETISKLGHAANNNNICTRCGADCPVELNLTAAEIADAQKVSWISERNIDNLEEEQRYRLMFALKDENENFLKVPVVVAIKIVNNNSETVFKATKIVRTSNYSGWTNSFGKEWTAAAIYIPYSEITPGSTDEGEIIFEVYNDYVSFEASTLHISDGLPLKATEVILPALPKSIHAYNYDDSVDSTVKITEITYEINGDDLYIYFTGEKTYDEEGKKHSQACEVGWKLYDSSEYIVDSGTFYSPAIAVGEKFRNEKEYAFDVIKPGETYTLKISNSSW